MLIFNKSGQAWSMDVIVALIIFTAGISILFFYAINLNNQSQINIDDLNYQGNFASEFILSEDRVTIYLKSRICGKIPINNLQMVRKTHHSELNRWTNHNSQVTKYQLKYLICNLELVVCL